MITALILSLPHCLSEYSHRCLVPILINELAKRVQGTDLSINGTQPHCPQYNLYTDSNFLAVTVEDSMILERNTFGMTFTSVAAM